MVALMIAIFLIGYLFIALEHPLKLNKSGTALLTGTILWVIYTYASSDHLTAIEAQLLESIGEIAGTLIFLVGAMMIVELIDSHGGFMFITNRITAKDKQKLLLIIATLTFFMSAMLDNLTSSIVMVVLVGKLIGNYKERWVFGSIIIIAANSGGAWSPIGDITTIMLWIRGNITAGCIIPSLFIPSVVSALVPVLIARRFLHGEISAPHNIRDKEEDSELLKELKTKEKLSILLLGVGCLLFVPLFKNVTHLPPFMGILFGVGVMWVYTEIMYRRHAIAEEFKLRLSKVVHRIDGTTLLFFLGILLAVDALRHAGILGAFSTWMDVNIGNIYAVNLIIGALSAIVDNVPLVAGAMGMYPVATDAMIAAAADPVYMANFAQDGVFWLFLAYCAGIGGSMLIIGSAAGVIVMGLEKIDFIWYLKRFSFLAALGYLAGAGVFILQQTLF